MYDGYEELLYYNVLSQVFILFLITQIYNMETYSHFRSETELYTGVLIWQIASPILILFGTVGNALSIIILSKQKFHRWASSVYLIGLAIADLCALYVGLLRQWIKYLFDSDIRSVHPVLCKLHWWFMYTCADVPVWILTAITVERLISTLYPYQSKLFCTKARATLVLVAIVTSALLVNSHLLYGFGQLDIILGNVTTIVPCAPLSEEYGHFFEKIWTWIDLCKFSLIPFVVLSSGNVCIIYKLYQSHKKTRSQVAPLSAPNLEQRHDRTSNLSILLVGLNCVFIASTLPVCVYFIGEPYWIPQDVPRDLQLKDPWWAFVNMLMYFNNSANFILYCLAGSRFRDAVRALFKFRREQNSNVITLNTRSARL